MCHDQVEELVRRGHDVTVLTSRWQMGKGRVEGNVNRLLAVVNPFAGESDAGLPSFLGLRLKRRRQQILMGFATYQNRKMTGQMIADVQPDVVFVWNTKSIGIGPVLAAQEAGIPVVFSLLDYWLADLKVSLASSSGQFKRWYHGLLNGLKDFDWLDVRHLILTSRAVRQTYIDQGFSSEHFQVISPGITAGLILDKDEIPGKETAKDQTLKLLFVGRLVPEKGLEVALRALAQAVQDAEIGHAKLDIIGEGAADYRLHLEDLIASLGLQERARLVGPLARRQVLERYPAYDVLLVPSLWVEPFGIIVIEAMARGLAIIATNHGGPSEIITDGYDGRLVPPGDPAALAQVIVELAGNSELTYQMRLQALQTVRERYTLERVVDQVEAYLKTVVDKQ